MPPSTRAPSGRPPHFGELIARLRTERRMRQQDVAALLGISTSTLSKQERTAECHLRRSTVQRFIEQMGRIKPLSAGDQTALLEGAHLPPSAIAMPEAPTPAPGGEFAAGGSWVQLCDSTYRQLMQLAHPQLVLAGLLELAGRLHVPIAAPEPGPATEPGPAAESADNHTEGATTRKRNAPPRTTAKRGVA